MVDHPYLNSVLTEHFGFIEFSHTSAFDMFAKWRFFGSSSSALGAYSFPIFVKGAVNCCFSQSLKLVAVVNKCSHVEIRFLWIGRLTTAVKEGHEGWPDAGSYGFTISRFVCLESALVKLCKLPPCIILWTLFLPACFVKINSENKLFSIIFWNSSHSFSGLPCPRPNPNCFIFSRPDKGSRNRHVKPVVSSWGGPSNL